MSDKLKQIINKQAEQQDTGLDQSDDIVQLVGFIIGEDEYAVPIVSIQEIIKPISWTRVPQTPPYVLGVFNLRGSVIPLFINQIKLGENISITNPNMTRFMMSLDEAVKLVLFAFENGKSGDIFVQKSPAATIELLANTLRNILKKPNHKIKIIEATVDVIYIN